MAKIKTPAKKPLNKKPDDENEEGQEGSESGDDDEDEDNAEEENRRINAIVTSRVKREMKGVLSALAGMQETLKNMSTAKPKAKDDDEDEDEDEEESPGAAKKAPEMDLKTSRKLTKLERELADEREARKKAEKDRSEEQDRAKRNEMRSLFQQALADHGVTDPKLQRAALNLLEEDGYMVRDEDGKVKFKGQDKYGIETMYDPKSGLKNWVLTEGKSFIPAVDAGGSGSGGSRARDGQTQNLTKGEYGKLNDGQKAAIELERASQGLPPLE